MITFKELTSLEPQLGVLYRKAKRVNSAGKHPADVMTPAGGGAGGVDGDGDDAGGDRGADIGTRGHGGVGGGGGDSAGAGVLLRVV